ncbi:uncharacterized protein [Montipora capricornis]|uniref:uncharacterized protein n=1 Tax=Montipora capricornis TaxID=246305 RepID=UPI0035F1A624
MGASPDIMITGSENEKSSDIDSAIQKPSCEAGVIDGVDEPAKESVDLKDDLSSVEDAAKKVVATEVTQEESVNLAEESMNAVSDVDTVTPQPGLHTTDESTSRNVAVVEMSNAEAKETDLTSTCNDPISVETAGCEMSSKDGEVVDNTVTADTKYSTQMIQTPCYDQQPKSKDEASTTDEEFKSKEKSDKSTPVVAGEKVQAKKSGKFLNRNKVAPMKEDSVQRNDKPAVKEEPVMVALQNTFYAMDKDKVLTYTGLRDGDDNIILVINPDNISSKTKEEQKSTWIQIREALEKNLPSEKFVMIIKPTMPLKSLKKLYKMMKESFSDQLSSFLLHRPGAKLKTAFYVCRPFLQKKMSKKIFVTNSQSVSGDHGIPRMILRFL